MNRLSGLLVDASKKYIFLFLATVLLLFHLVTLLRWPPIHVDEAWNANRAWGVLETGNPFGTMDYEAVSELPGYEYFYPRLPIFIHVLILQITGSPDIFLLRLGSLIGGVVLLLAVYSIGTAFSGRRTGSIAFLLTGASIFFFYSSHMARPDIFAAACGYWAIALVLHSNSKQVSGNLIAGLLVGMAVEIHPLGVIFGPTVLVLRVLQDGRSVLKMIGFWMLAIGLAVGASFYVGLHILPNPDTYFKINELIFAKAYHPPIMSGDIQAILTSYEKLLSDAGMFAIPQIILAIMSLSIIVIRPIITRQQKMLLAAIIIVPSLTVGLFARTPFFYNYILITPVIDLVIAIYLQQLTWQQMNGRFWLKVYSAVAIGLLVAGYIIYVPYFFLREDNWNPFMRNMAQVLPFIRPGDRLMGDQIYWFGLYENDYDGWEELVYFHRNTPGTTWEEALIHYQPDVFILDSWVLMFATEEDSADPFGLWIPQEELIDALDKHGVVVAKIDGTSYGEIYIYRLTWP